MSRCAFAVLKDETVCLCAEGHEVIDDGEDVHLSDVRDHIQPEDVIVGGRIHSDVGDPGYVGSISSGSAVTYVDSVEGHEGASLPESGGVHRLHVGVEELPYNNSEYMHQVLTATANVLASVGKDASVSSVKPSEDGEDRRERWSDELPVMCSDEGRSSRFASPRSL